MKITQKILKTFTLILIFPFIVWFLFAGLLKIYYLNKPYPQETTWGLTFSTKASAGLGLNWRETYLSILDDLKPGSLRLIAYWDQVEPQKDNWDFSALDWQIQEANKRDIPFIIAIGQKTPRWPECNAPSWIDIDSNEKKTELIKYEGKVIERYKDQPNLIYWQVENEPLVKFGVCPKPDQDLLADEIVFTREKDPSHPILITDGERLTLWYKAGNLGDALGLAIYRKMSLKNLGVFTLPQIPEFYPFKASLTRFIDDKPDPKYLFAEVGLEPWGDKFTPDDFDQTVNFAKETRFDTFYLWGAEWWYKEKQIGDPTYWNKAKSIFVNDSARYL